MKDVKIAVISHFQQFQEFNSLKEKKTKTDSKLKELNLFLDERGTLGIGGC